MTLTLHAPPDPDEAPPSTGGPLRRVTAALRERRRHLLLESDALRTELVRRRQERREAAQRIRTIRRHVVEIDEAIRRLEGPSE